MADRVVGLSAFGNILGALYHRQKTGEGQRLDIPMFETMTQFVLGDHMGGRSFEPPLGQPGYARLLAESRRPFRTSDGHICVLIYNDKQWRSFRSEEHTSELQSLMRISYAVFCLKKKKTTTN